MPSISVLRIHAYPFYVVVLFSLAYLLNQLGRYALPLATQPMAQDLHYGDKACLVNETLHDLIRDPSWKEGCVKHRNASTCLQVVVDNLTNACKWDYNGQGLAYQLLVGPVFILIYTFTGVVIGFAGEVPVKLLVTDLMLWFVADSYNRRNLLAIAVFFWNGMTVLTALVQSYWQLVLTRMGLGLGVSGCNPFAVSILTDIVPPELRAAAFGIYNWGIYTGYSMSFFIGNLVVPAVGWRYFFFVCGAPGIVIAALIMFTVREPPRRIAAKGLKTVETKNFRTLMNEGNSFFRSLSLVMKPLFTPAIMVLFMAGAIRNGAGYVWGYNTHIFYESISAKSSRDARIEIASYLSWVPMVAGSISVFGGGLVTDHIVKRFGVVARVWALTLSQLLAAPFAAGALFLSSPWCYLILIPSYIISELWVSVCQAVLVELIPATIRTSAIAVYFFVITNIGGNMTLLVPVIKNLFVDAGYAPVESLRNALYILYPGMMALSGAIFAFATTLIRKQDVKFVMKPDNIITGDVDPQKLDHLNEPELVPLNSVQRKSE